MIALAAGRGVSVAQAIAACGIHRETAMRELLRYDGIQSYGIIGGIVEPPHALYTCRCGTTIAVALSEVLHGDLEPHL